MLQMYFKCISTTDPRQPFRSGDQLLNQHSDLLLARQEVPAHHADHVPRATKRLTSGGQRDQRNIRSTRR